MARLGHPRVRLPRGLHFALTWGIPDDYGGMTSALLHRSRTFVRLAGTPVDILTFDERADLASVIAELRRRGELVDGVRIVNLWEWLREHELSDDAPGTLTLERHPFTPLPRSAEFASVHRDGAELTRTRYASDGTTVLQVDHYRSDGTLLLVDRRDVREPGLVGGRSVVLCDPTGVPVRSWGRIWALYRFWIDRLRERAPACLIVDSKTVARFALTYRRKRAVTMHVVHSSHLAGPERPHGVLKPSRREVFEHLDDFDGVVLLTRRQRDDVEALLGRRDNVCVIPNSIDLPRHVALDRDPARGVVLAGLGRGKRVDHAIAAVARSGADVRLDVYGEGPERARLERLAAGLPVRLHGHRPGARAELATASFCLITGTLEGFPLVIVEAMAAGCIPIAYDVPYGAADVIRDGRNGMLVPSGDVDALARAIARVRAMPPADLRRLRRAARRTAERFTDLAVTREWARQLRAAAARKAAHWAARPDSGVTPIDRTGPRCDAGSMNVLQRPRQGRVIAGVCAAIARRFGWDTTLVRVLAVLSILLPGPQVLIYLICWLVIPNEPLPQSSPLAPAPGADARA